MIARLFAAGATAALAGVAVLAGVGLYFTLVEPPIVARRAQRPSPPRRRQ